MAQSKYDVFWTKLFEANGGVVDVLDFVRKQDKVILKVEGIQEIGSRASWYGKTIVSNKGNSGGDIMAHTKALKNILPVGIEEGEEFSASMNVKGDSLTLVYLG